jgi:hypothetical protein
MSKVFRRPMFRGGSTNMNGIMSGIEDRKNYSIGTEDPAATPVSAGDRYKEIYDKYAQPTIDPLGKYLIQGSLQGFSENRGGSTLGNLGLAFGGENLNQLFSDIEGQRTGKRDMELAKLGYDIDEEQRQAAIAREDKIRTENQTFEQDLLNQKVNAESQLAKDKMAFDREQKGSDRANKLEIKMQDGKNKIAELQFKIDNPGASEFRTDQVRPAFENVVTKRAEAFMQSKNPAVKQNPTLTAQNYIRFTREASPEIQSKFKGFKPYTRDNKGNIVESPYEGKPGEIVYDPISQDFLVFDNTGNTYILNPLTFEIDEN